MHFLTRTSAVLNLLFVAIKLSDDRRHLHSFPTRRSSDLKEIGRYPVFVPRADADGMAIAGVRMLALAAPRATSASMRTRSEEHTSELQSRVDLVCRLLLEKKKRGGYLPRRTLCPTTGPHA